MQTQQRRRRWGTGGLAGNPLFGGARPVSPLLTSLVAYYKLDEASGVGIDSAGSNTLTDNNTVTSAAGKVGTARQFTLANSEFLSIADNAALSSGDIDFTITAWVYFDTLATTQMLVTKDIDTDVREYLVNYDQSSNRFQFSVREAGLAFVTAVANNLGAPSTATWYFVVAWHDATANTVNIQVNNGTVDSVPTAGPLQAEGGAPFQIGARAFATFENYMDGRIDEVGFWKRVLTAAERTQLYNGGNGTTYPF